MSRPRQARGGGLIHRVWGTVLLLLAAVAPVAGQADEEIVRGFVGGSASLSALHDDPVSFLSLEGGLLLSSRVRIGGAGHLLPAKLDIGSVLFQPLELAMGYGGVFVEVAGDAPVLDVPAYVRLLVGAGNADVRNADTGLRLGSDNFVTIEPEVGVERRLVGRLHATAGVAWRWVDGVDDLPGVRTADLRSPSLRIRIRFHPL